MHVRASLLFPFCGQIYFGISAAISGSLMSASSLTVNGDLLITAVSCSPLVNRSQMDRFAESMVGSLEVAALQKKPLSRCGICRLVGGSILGGGWGVAGSLDGLHMDGPL